jgi:hypothetical protein
MRSRSIVVLALAAAACGDSSGPAFTSSGPCDAALAIDSNDPMHAARAMGICDGLVSAAWVYPNGSAATTSADFNLGHGLLPAFGTNNPPREGAVMLALSTGTARAPNQPNYSSQFNKNYSTVPPAGFPKNETSCPAVSSSGHDGIALQVVLTVPAGVRFLAFEYAYFSADYSVYPCTSVLDQTAGLATNIGGSAAAQNVMLDPAGNAVFVSKTAIRACANAISGYTCSLGTAPLAGTGFESNGGSGWLRTANLAVTPGSTVQITIMIWDSLDHIGDSSLLIDNFAWIP